MAGELRGGFASVATEEAAWRTVASWARVLFFTLVFVLTGGVIVGTAVVTYLGVGGAVAFGDIVSKTMTACALKEWFGGDSDLQRDALVVHESLLLEKLTDCGACGVVDKDMGNACGSIWVSGFGGPSGAIVEMESS